MSSSNKGFVTSFFDGMPPWQKTIVSLLCLLPLSLAISGMMLNVNVGANINKYLDIKFEMMASAQEGSMGEVMGKLEEMEERFTIRVGDNETLMFHIQGDVKQLKDWACEHGRVQGLRDDSPGFCDGSG